MQFWHGIFQRSFRFFFTSADLVTQWIYRVSRGVFGHNQAGFNILLLTSMGRKSGKERTHALLYIKVKDGWVVVASNGGDPKRPNWYHNLLSQPRATIQVGKLVYEVEANAISGAERTRLWQLLVDVWPAYENYQAGIQREIPVILLRPVKQLRFNGVILNFHRSGNYMNVVKSLPVINSIKKVFMFIPIHRKTFLRDVIVIQAGFALFGFSIAALIRSNLGTSAWAVLEVALSNIMHLSPGTLSVIVGFVVLLVAISMQEKVGWGTLVNILFIGPWEDLFLSVIPSLNNNLILQFGLLLIGILAMGIASSIYIGVDAGAGPRDSLMLAIKRKTGWSIRLSRAVIELCVVLVGWLLKGPLGVGTLIFALLIGPAVQWGFKLFKVQPHKNLADATV